MANTTDIHILTALELEAQNKVPSEASLRGLLMPPPHRVLTGLPSGHVSLVSLCVQIFLSYKDLVRLD